MQDKYWTEINSIITSGMAGKSEIATYEHQLPHGMLVMVVITNDVGSLTPKKINCSVTFVPAAPVGDGVYR